MTGELKKKYLIFPHLGSNTWNRLLKQYRNLKEICWNDRAIFLTYLKLKWQSREKLST